MRIERVPLDAPGGSVAAPFKVVIAGPVDAPAACHAARKLLEGTGLSAQVRQEVLAAFEVAAARDFLRPEGSA